MRRRGFTLVELLVVISIIALLLAILMPALNRARESSRTVVCKNKEKQIMMGYRLYANEFNGFAPASGYNYPLWVDTMMPYLLTAAEYKSNYGQDKPLKYLTCPSATKIPLVHYWSTHYAANISVLAMCENSDTGAPVKWMRPVKVDGFRQPSRTVAFIDWWNRNKGGTCAGNMFAGPQYMPTPNNPTSSSYKDATKQLCRHGGRANVAFADSHIDQFRDTLDSSGYIKDIGSDSRVAPWFNH